MDLPFDIEDLRVWLDRNAIGEGPLSDLTLLAGGTQNILLRFQRAGETYVLRRPPRHPRENSNETMRREARVLQALAGTPVPHPRLVAACGETEPLGTAFYVMQNIDGFNATTGLPPLHAGSADIRRQMGLAMVDAIAALAGCDYKALGLDDFGKPEGFLQRQVPRWRAQLESYGKVPAWPGPSGLPGVGQVAAWLEANIPTDYAPGINHGDFHLANVMFRHDGPEVAAIIDWELSSIGDPLLDLGWLIATWPDEGETARSKAVFAIEPWDGFPTAEELIAHYGKQTGRCLDHIDWYVVLACFKLGIILEGTFVRACTGRAPRDIGEKLHANSVALFAKALARIDRVSGNLP